MNFTQRCMKISRNLSNIADDIKKSLKKHMGSDHREGEVNFLLFVVANNPDAAPDDPVKSWVSYLSSAERLDVIPMLETMIAKWKAEGFANENEAPLHERH